VFDNRTLGALSQAWKGYIVAKNNYEYDKIEYYVSIIQKLQNELGLTVTSFPDIGMSAKFYFSRYSEYISENNKKITQ